ncbi:MAG: hypothetical protein ABIQ51_09215 [Mesorhizobium sp.]
MEALREWMARNIAQLLFLSFYFLTVVLGNLLYASPAGRWLITADGLPADSLSFDTTFTFGFWVLLLMPLVLVPVGVWILRPVMQRFVIGAIVRLVPDFRRTDYLIAFAAVVSFVAYALWRTEAFTLVGNAMDAKQAIQARFILQGRLSFAEKIAIHSLLPFMSFYAIAAAIKTGERLWFVLSVLTVATTCTALVAINMKWPVLVFYMGAIAGIFMFSKKWPYLKAVLGGIGLVVFYFVISTYVFRWVPQDVAVQHSFDNSRGADLHPSLDYSALAESSFYSAPFLVIHAVNRMAISYPYYYKIFTDEGPVCGTLIQTYIPGKKPCAPTFLVYSRIFPDDGYAGRGSAPAAPQITAYAQQGWVGAVVGVLFVALVLAAFSAIPLSAGPMAAAFSIIGATVGYHYSQLPLEGPITYDHGVLWPFLLVIIYALSRYSMAAAHGRRTA